MTEQRKFYVTVLKVEVLSEEPFDYEDLADVHYQITDGDCSGQVTQLSQDMVDAKQMANLLKSQGSGPEFFMIEDIEGQYAGKFDRMNPALTLDELIEKAIKAREISPLGGDTVVTLCEDDREYLHFVDAKLDYEPDYPENGAVFILKLMS